MNECRCNQSCFHSNVALLIVVQSLWYTRSTKAALYQWKYVLISIWITTWFLKTFEFCSMSFSYALLPYKLPLKLSLFWTLILLFDLTKSLTDAWTSHFCCLLPYSYSCTQFIIFFADQEKCDDDEMERLYKSLEQASLSPIGDRRLSTKKELRKSFIKRSKNPSINEKLHKIRMLNSTLKVRSQSQPRKSLREINGLAEKSSKTRLQPNSNYIYT